MTKKRRLILSAGLAILIPVRAMAVWPPSTVLEEESSQSGGLQTSEMEARKKQPLKQRLEEDELRLHLVLEDLQKDAQDLKRPKIAPAVEIGGGSR